MENWQTAIVVFFLIFSMSGFAIGINESKNRKNAYGKAGIFNLIGAFVWGDVVIFSIFWILVSLVCLILNDWVLFLLIYSVFWLVRSIGETIYWFNQQFSSINRNPPKEMWFFKYFHNDSVWFVYQIYWQCLTVVTIITSVYLTHLWLN